MMEMSRWSEQQRYCLAQMGVDALYFEQDSSPVLADNVSEKAPRGDLKQPKSNLREAPSAVPTKAVAPVTESVTSAVEKVGTHNNDNSPPTQAQDADTMQDKPQAGVQSVHNDKHAVQQLSVQKSIIVVGHQSKFEDFLSGKQFVADLCLYLKHGVDVFSYVNLSLENHTSQLLELLHSEKEMNNHSDDKKNMYFIIAQSEEQIESIKQIMSGDDELQKFKDDVVLLPPLTALLSQPQVKAETLKMLL